MIRLAVTGAAGKMGRMIVKVIGETTGVELAAAVDRKDSPFLGADAGELAGIGKTGIAIEADLERAFTAQVIIDFSSPAATLALADAAAARSGPALVVGTTGLGPAEESALQSAAERIALVQSANMSLGVNVLLGLVEQAARALGGDYDVEVVELHHRHKRDAPSGTALAIARAAATALDRDLAAVGRYERHGDIGPRGADEIGVAAVRGGDIVGEHTIYFCGLGERLEVSHRATSRDTFARGAVRAAIWVHQRAKGRYDMRDVLGLR